DSLRSLRTLAITSMLIVVVWMLSWQSMNDRLARYGPAAELQSWVDLGQRLKNLKVDVFTVDLKESIDWDEMDAPPRAPNFEVGTDRVDLQVVVTWPKPLDYSISLEPVARGKNAEIESRVARVYRVVPRRGGGGAR